jgi:sialic acid synthase SpsE
MSMGTLELKTELQRMIEQETDVNVLKAILTILQKTSLDPVLKEKLTSRALASEDDIKAGRLFSKEEILKRTGQ